MKSYLLAFVAILSLSMQSICAASPEEEARFLGAVKAAFQQHDAEGLIALTCWDRVPDHLKDSGKKRYAREIALTAIEIRISAPDPSAPDLEWKDEAGVAYRSNLAVTKHVKITFAPGSTLQLKRGTVKVKDVTYPVGEKEAKLLLLQPAPVK